MDHPYITYAKGQGGWGRKKAIFADVQYCTECPTDMLTTSDPILQFLKPHISKSKTCFEKFVKKSFRWHLETQQNEIGSIFKLNIKKLCQTAKTFLHHA